jgi:hypothetical protein
MDAEQIIKSWPDESREAAQLVIDARGVPDEATASMLIWHHAAPWKRLVATRDFHEHSFPAPHIDAVESFVDFRVPVEKFSDLAEFDGAVVADRTAGEVSARCHDEHTNYLALNLMHDIVTGAKTVEEARSYYAKEFLDYRRKEPTPYMEGLRFTPDEGPAGDPDISTVSNEDVQEAATIGVIKIEEA